MGRVHLEHLGGEEVFICTKCKTYLTNIENLMSDHFVGVHGTAKLFRKVVNVTHG